MTTAVKWLFVGLNLPWDLDLGSFDGEGRVGGWMMDRGGGSTVNDHRCKPLGSLPFGFTIKVGKFTPATSQMLVHFVFSTSHLH